jgi:predicted Zn-dependent peptidase
MFGIYFAVDPKRALETAELVLNELHKLRKEYVTAAELQGAVEYTKGSLLLASESNDNQMVRSAQNEIHFNRNIELQEVIEKVESVTTKEILNLAQSLFEKKKMVLTMLGPVQDKKPFEDILYS